VFVSLKHIKYIYIYIHTDTGTRTNVVCFRRVLLSDVNGLSQLPPAAAKRCPFTTSIPCSRPGQPHVSKNEWTLIHVSTFNGANILMSSVNKHAVWSMVMNGRMRTTTNAQTWRK